MNENIILGIGIIIIFVIVFLVLKVCSHFRAWVYELFLIAEKKIESGKKMDYVVQQIYSELPFPASVFLNEKVLRYVLQKMFDVIKDFLNDGVFNNN